MMKKIFTILAASMLAFSFVTAQNKIERETFMYAEKDGQKLHLDTYVDHSMEYEGKRPVMIYVHGGGFSMGSRINALQIKYNKHFATQGFVSISIDYRKELKAGESADQPSVLRAINYATEDLFDATAFILKKAEEWNIDTEKIIISGGSAGAVACLNAEYEICNSTELASRLPKGFNYAGIVSQAGCITVPKDSLEWQTAPCPILLMHGDKDLQVPYENYSIEGNLYAGSNYIHKQLVEMDTPHWLYIEAGADHIVALKPLQYNFSEIDAFIDKFVIKGEHAMVHTVWTDKEPGSMEKMFEIVPLYMIGWEKTDEEVEAEKK
ncbi:MAG: alpha/beta hydrolase [Bacteroidetes bacterium]|nr:alpha/beta hydrolase [Bacteroidota bacterium]